jgi:hypothetical protein
MVFGAAGAAQTTKIDDCRKPKPCEFIGFGAMDVTKPYRFKWFGAMDVTNGHVLRLPPVSAQGLDSFRGHVLV